MSSRAIKAQAMLCAPILLALLLQGCVKEPVLGGQIYVDMGAGGQSGGANLGAGTGEGPQSVESATVSLMSAYGKSERPQVRVLTDTKPLKANQPAIYANAEDGMLLVAWKDLLVIYDSKSGTVVQELAINTFEG